MTENRQTHCPPDEIELADLVTHLTDRVRRGEQLDEAKLESEYPQHASALKELLPTIRAMMDVDEAKDFRDGSSDDQHLSTGQVLGDFKLVRELGRGGMGIVYEATQLSLSRQVALKMLPLVGMLDQRQLVRFQNEARAAASLHHPQIVPVFFVGKERGIHFYVMQLIEGQSLAEVLEALRVTHAGEPPNASSRVSEDLCTVDWSQSHRANTRNSSHSSAAYELTPADSSLDTRAKVQAAISTERSGSRSTYFRNLGHLMKLVAEALDHAHESGITHRDVKPANIMLDTDGCPWVTDFGLARLEGDAGVTMTGDLLGTIRYMSPEQALANRAIVDHRTDIYSLGVTLYELATLTPAVTGENRQEVLQFIAFQDPVAPRRVDHEVPVELETIILKAIEKRPEDRYATAKALAEDLDNFLAYRPLQAKPTSAWGQLKKWIARHQAIALVGGVALTALTLISLLSLLWIMRANRDLAAARDTARATADDLDVALQQAQAARDQSEAERNIATQNLYRAEMRQAMDDYHLGQIDRVYDSLAKFLPSVGNDELRKWEWSFLLGLCHQEEQVLRGHTDRVLAISLSPKGHQLASASDDGTVRIWDLSTGKTVRVLDHDPRSIYTVSWFPRDDLVATGNKDHTIRLWNPATGEQIGDVIPIREFGGELKSFDSLAWTPDGTRLAAISLGGVTLKVFDTQTRELVWSKQGASIDLTPRAAAWSPNGAYFATANGGGNTGAIQIYDAAAMEELHRFEEPGDLFCLAWAPDGRRIAWGEYAQRAGIIDLETGEIGILRTSQPVRSLAWTPDGRYLATAMEQQITVWDTNELAAARRFVSPAANGQSIAWAHNGTRLVSGGSDGGVHVFRFDPIDTPSGASNLGYLRQGFCQWNRNGRLLCTSTYGGESIQVRNLSTGKSITIEGPIYSPTKTTAIDWSPVSDELVYASDRSTLVVVDGTTGEHRTTIDHPENGRLHFARWSPDGEKIALAIQPDDDDFSRLQIRDRQDGRLLHQAEVSNHPGVVRTNLTTAEWSPDGRWIVTAGWDGRVRLWETESLSSYEILGKQPKDFTYQQHWKWIAAFAWSPDGQWLASGGWDKTIKIWNVQDRSLHRTLGGHVGFIHSLCWISDDRLLSTGADRTLRLWDVAAGAEIFESPTEGTAFAQLSPDSRWLALATENLDLIDVTRGESIWSSGDADSFFAEALLRLEEYPSALKFARRAATRHPDHEGHSSLQIDCFREVLRTHRIEDPARTELDLLVPMTLALDQHQQIHGERKVRRLEKLLLGLRLREVGDAYWHQGEIQRAHAAYVTATVRLRQTCREAAPHSDGRYLVELARSAEKAYLTCVEPDEDARSFYDESLAAYERSISASSEDNDLDARIALCRLESRGPFIREEISDELLSHCLSIFEAHGSHVDATLNLARVYATMNRAKEAVDLLANLAAKELSDEQLFDAELVRGFAQLGLDRTDLAHRSLAECRRMVDSGKFACNLEQKHDLAWLTRATN